MQFEAVWAPLAHWVHDLDPVIWHIAGPIALRWYGLSYLAGFAAAWLLLAWYRRAGRSALDAAQRERLFFALIIGVMVGGRLGSMLLYDFSNWLRDPLLVLRFWDGGMASHGGFIGVCCALWWFAGGRRRPLLATADLISTVTAPGLFFGRIANFINGELWGRISDVPWAVIFPGSAHPNTPVEWIAPRHPSQLYEAALEGLVLFAYMQWRFWRGGPATRHPGRLTAEFLLAYAILRSIGEVFREPDAGLILGLSRGVFYSLFLALAGIALLVWIRRTRAGETGRA
jgi:phosphatidylglycerol:prolipoprotein diacylglycerol transferase